MTDFKYFHDEVHHNLIAPSIIVPYLLSKIQPKSVVDVGCGIGTFLKIFHENGLKDYLGIDGDWVNMDLLRKYIDINNFKVFNLEEDFNLNRRFDLAITLEVAEHLKQESADIFVDNLVRLSDVIVFSAAFPGQGGQNHINEQWPDYWANIFEKFNYKMFDVFRPLFWNDERIPAWYRQNMFLILNKHSIRYNELLIQFKVNENSNILNYIHPIYFDLYKIEAQELDKYKEMYNLLNKGKSSFNDYAKMFTKYLFRKLHIYTK